MRQALPTRARLASVGVDGWFCLALTCVIVLLSAGVSWLACLAVVLWVAARAPTVAAGDGALIVLGAQPRPDGRIGIFKTRLRRAAAQKGARRICICGGVTRADLPSEAAMGADVLADLGVARDRLVLEDRSQNTRQNFLYLRDLMPPDDRVHDLITSRAHMARALMLGMGYGYRLLPCGAEERLRWRWKTPLWLAREALYVHWLIVWRLCFATKFV